MARIFAISIVLFTVVQATAFAAQLRPRQGNEVFDPEAPPETKFRLAPMFTFGADIELDSEYEKNFDLENGEDDDLGTLRPELSLAVSFEPNENIEAFLEVELSQEFAPKEGRQRRKRDRRAEVELKKAYLLFNEKAQGGFSLQLGRQRFKDEREWLYDDELDAVRLFFHISDLSIELAAGWEALVWEGLTSAEREERSRRDRIRNFILYGRYPLREKIELGAYILVREDRSSRNESPIFYGLRSGGKIIDDVGILDAVNFWLELGHVRGRDRSTKLRGVGFDVGSSVKFEMPYSPFIGVGYAFGTGDADPNDQEDRSFRQTGLHDNESKFEGKVKFKHYGELFDPELSNLSIFTAGIGFRPTEKSSIEFVYHYYLQDETSRRIRDSEIDARPTGLSRRLGQEIDLVAGFRKFRVQKILRLLSGLASGLVSGRIDAKLVLGYFIPGRAFPSDADDAFFANFEFEYEF